MRTKTRGIYAFYSTVEGKHKAYVGQSEHIDSRLKQHWSRLIKGTHDNSHLQNHYDKYSGGLEVVTLYRASLVEDLTYLENLQANKHLELGFELFNQSSIAPGSTMSDNLRVRRSEIMINYHSENREVSVENSIRSAAIANEYWVKNPDAFKARINASVATLKKYRENNPEAQKARQAAMVEKTSKPVSLYKNGTFIDTFPSFSAAARFLNVSTASIHNWVTGKRNSRGGYTVI